MESRRASFSLVLLAEIVHKFISNVTLLTFQTVLYFTLLQIKIPSNNSEINTFIYKICSLILLKQLLIL